MTGFATSSIHSPELTDQCLTPGGRLMMDRVPFGKTPAIWSFAILFLLCFLESESKHSPSLQNFEQSMGRMSFGMRPCFTGSIVFFFLCFGGFGWFVCLLAWLVWLVDWTQEWMNRYYLFSSVKSWWKPKWYLSVINGFEQKKSFLIIGFKSVWSSLLAC